MKLIVILICLGLERYLNVGSVLRRFTWFDGYVNWLRRTVHAETFWKGSNGVILVVAPAVILTAVIYFSFYKFFHASIGMIISFIVLLYCLGPEDLHNQLKSYFSAVDHNEITINPAGGSARALTEMIFVQANERLFAVLFWFFILGPVGAVLYRISTLLRHKVENDGSYNTKMVTYTIAWNDLLDWIPARIVALLYGLAGNLNASIAHWLKQLLVGIHNNHALLISCGLSALDAKEQADINENRAAMEMVDRVLIITLVILIIFTLGVLFY